MQDKIINTELDKVLNVPGSTSSSASQVAAIVVASPSSGAGSVTDSGNSAVQNSLVDAIALSTAQLAEVRAAVEGQLASLTENTRAVAENTSAKSAGAAVAGVAGSMLNTVLGGGILGPIVSGIMDLFGGDDQSQATATLTKYALPPAVSYNAGVQNGVMTGVDYGMGDTARAAGSAATSSQQQVTVNITAMDSRSFLDHSADIANAVRRAMLESSSLNDVIGEM